MDSQVRLVIPDRELTVTKRLFSIGTALIVVLAMGYSPDTFVAFGRLRYNSGELFGPTIFESRLMNHPYGRTSGIATVAQGRDTVRYARRLGYDFIKVYSFLDDTVYDAIMREAKAQGITVIGHQTFAIGLRRGFEMGLRMVAHAEELRPAFGVPVSSERADSLVQLFKEFGTWLTPTLATFDAINNTWGNAGSSRTVRHGGDRRARVGRYHYRVAPDELSHPERLSGPAFRLLQGGDASSHSRGRADAGGNRRAEYSGDDSGCGNSRRDRYAAVTRDDAL